MLAKKKEVAMTKQNKQSLGGKKRAESLTEGQRKTIASEAAKARWEEEAKLPKAEYRGEIVIGDIKIPCAVLDNGVRVISERGVRGILGPSGGNSYALKKSAADSGANLPVFLAQKQLTPYIDDIFGEAPITPIKYKSGRNVMQGYSAELLPKICDVWLKAREVGALQRRQLVVAARAEILMRGLAHIGVIALIDEATGFQEIRDRKALQQILEKFIAKELQPWVKTFPDEYYENMFRLKKWGYKPLDKSRPGVVGTYTNNLVYERLAPGILEELKKITPKTASGNRKFKYFQKLTPDTGHPKLKEHISNIVVLMKVNNDWESFIAMVNKAMPKYLDGRQLTLFAPQDEGGDNNGSALTSKG